jgi:hypothetical protein
MCSKSNNCIPNCHPAPNYYSSKRQKKTSTVFLLRGRQAHFLVCFQEEGHHELAAGSLKLKQVSW